MPLNPGTDKATVSKNIEEFHTGKTFAHTAEKFGEETADKQAIAVALSEKRKSEGRQPHKRKTRRSLEKKG